MRLERDTIVAVATPPGVGGIGVVRISGPDTCRVAEALLGSLPKARHAALRDFLDADGSTIDRGLALYFPGPASFTGEDVLELQGHGGPVVLDLIVARALALGARAARPGEFSERAFLNGQLDLTQAEAIADLIDAGSEAAARAAMRSLDGAFSDQVGTLSDQLTELRVYIEAAIDFAEEEIDHLADEALVVRFDQLSASLTALRDQAGQGRLLTEGLRVVIAGRPNVGKSSLLNALAGSEAAIVTDLPGTTRDVLRERIVVHGIPLHVSDTAGFRDGGDVVEQEGMRRAKAELTAADLALYVSDRWPLTDDDAAFRDALPARAAALTVRSKVDLTDEGAWVTPDAIAVSTKTGEGLDALRDAIARLAGQNQEGSSTLSARRRHVDALARVSEYVDSAHEQLEARQGELVAEELRQAQRVLGEITGEVTADDLLGHIFASFCIGK
jgi:tRNA modification GTPase